MSFVKTEEKQVLIDNLKVNYKIMGTGSTPIILLHGWGINSDKYSATAEYLSQTANGKLPSVAKAMDGARIVIPDLPGFGKSDNPSGAWGVDDYAEFTKKFADVLGLSNFILIGHSFGGRIAIKFSVKYPEEAKTLILTGAAGIKHPLNAKQKLFYAAAKAGKAFLKLPLIGRFKKPVQKLLYRAAREKDYFEAQGIMKEVFKKTIDEDLTPYLDKIEIQTLLIWGKDDKSTPISDARIMLSKIKNCELEIIDGANHSLPYQKPEKFAKITKEFLKKKR